MSEDFTHCTDLTSRLDIIHAPESKKIMTCSIMLDKKCILQALMFDVIYINGRYYKVPERQFLYILLNKTFGLIQLELEEEPNP